MINILLADDDILTLNQLNLLISAMKQYHIFFKRIQGTCTHPDTGCRDAQDDRVGSSRLCEEAKAPCNDSGSEQL